MRQPHPFLAACLLLTAPPMCLAARPCYAPEEAATHAGKEICLQAHVYAVQEQADGTRYLNLCGPETTECRFTVVSMPTDRADVGSLDGLAQTDIHLRGVVHVAGDEAFLILSAKRQLRDGSEKFRPNPALLSGFSAANGGTGFRDPALSSHHKRGASVFGGSATAKRQ